MGMGGLSRCFVEPVRATTGLVERGIGLCTPQNTAGTEPAPWQHRFFPRPAKFGRSYFWIEKIWDAPKLGHLLSLMPFLPLERLGSLFC